MKKIKGNINDMLITMIFAIIPVLFLSILYDSGRLSVSIDWLFHASRLEQIYTNLKQGTIATFIQTNYAQQTGVGSFMFYPTLFLYPWAFLRFIFKPIEAFYIWVGVFYFVSLMINYFSLRTVNKINKLTAFIFSLIFTLTPYKIHLTPETFVLGEFIASTFIILPFVGLYHILSGNKKKWWMLPLGMVLLTYSHILSVVISTEILTVIVIYKMIMKKITWNQIRLILQSVIVSILLTLPITTLFLTDFIGKGVSSTYAGVELLNSLGQVFNDSISNNTSAASIGLILMITAISGWYWTRGIYKKIYTLGIALLLLSTSIFPWISLDENVFTVIQLPWRYLLYVTMFLSIIAAKGLADLIEKKVDWNLNVVALLIGAVFLVVTMGSLNNTYKNVTNTIQNKERLLKRVDPNAANNTLLESTLLNNKNYQYQFEYVTPVGETDYYPLKALKHNHFFDLIALQHERALTSDKLVHSIYTNEMFVNGKAQRITPKGYPNKLGYQINIRKKAKVDIPAIAYSHTYVTVDGKEVNYNISKRGTVQIELPKGNHTVEIGYRPVSWYRKVTLISVVLGTIFGIYILIGSFIDFKKK